jgi:hypothetical protein
MFKPTLLSLPLLLAGASCVPLDARPNSSGNRDLAYVDLAEMDGAPNFELVLPEHATGPLPKVLPRIDPVAIAPGAPAKPFEITGQAEDDQRRSLDCLTQAVYHEARSETEDGQRAVAQVVLNRVRHSAFPNSVCGVVFQGSQRSTGCQFSFTCDGSLRRRIEPSAWDRARQVAEQALAGSVYEPVGVATHYHTTAVRPWWAASLTRAVTVGSHIFYRWRGSWGHPLAFKERYAGAEPGPAASVPVVTGDGSVVEVSKGPVVRIAALVEGVRVNIHRTRPSAPGPDSDTGVKVHRGSGASSAAPAVAVHVGEPGMLTAPAPAEEVVATE